MVSVVKTIGADRKRRERISAEANAIVNQIFVRRQRRRPHRHRRFPRLRSEVHRARRTDREPEVLTVDLDLDAVTAVGGGTEGFNRMWSPDGSRRPDHRPAHLPGAHRPHPLATERSSLMTAEPTHEHHGTPAEATPPRVADPVRPGLHDPIIVLGIFGVIASCPTGAVRGALPDRHTVAMLFTALQLRADGPALPRLRLTPPMSARRWTPGWGSSWDGRSCSTTCSCPGDLVDRRLLPVGQFPGVPFFVWILAFIVITSGAQRDRPQGRRAHQPDP